MSRLSAVMIAAIVLACAALVGLHFSNGNGGGGEDPSDPSMSYTDLPDGITADTGSCTFRSSGEIAWKVYDRFHTYYGTDQHGSFTSLYQGTESAGTELHLEPGKYTVSANGGKFDVTVYGGLSMTKSWEYDMDGTVMEAVVTYTLSVAELEKEWAFADEFNTRGSPATSSGLVYQFSDLPQLVRIGDSVISAAESIRAEYIRLGGDVGDSQSFLDFIAGFVQKSVKYPSTIPGHSGEYDYGIYGKTEYWAVPAQTLWLLYGDCEDDSALFCALASYFGFDVAMAGKSGHVFAGVVIDGFAEVDASRLASLGVGYMQHVSHTDVYEASGKTYQAVELIKGQAPVGYCMGVSFGAKTYWGATGFYPVG